MNILPDQHSQQSMIFSLFRHIPTTVIVHFVAAAFLIYIVFNSISAVNIDYIYHWGSVLVCSLLLRSLILTMFLRKYVEDEVSPSTWESIHARSSVLVSIVFSVGYCYLATLGNPLIWAMLSLIMVMHLSCVVIPSSSSKQALSSTVLPIAIPFIGLLLFTSEPSAVMFACGIAIYTVTILLISYNLHHKLIDGFQTESLFEEEVKISQVLKEKLQHSTIEDPETHILNKRFFDLMIDHEIRRTKRGGGSLTIALIGIDCYEEYLSRYGQAKTLKCVQSIAKILSKATPRGGEFMTRYSTEKFALIVPNIKKEEVLAFASKMMHLVNSANIEHSSTTVKNSLNVSLSIGIAEFSSGNIIDVKQLVQQCELAFNAAKQTGGNNMQVSTASFVTKKTEKSHSSFDESDELVLASCNADILV